VKYRCKDENRRSKIATHKTFTGIDYLEVDEADQHKLYIHFIPSDPAAGSKKPIPKGITAANIKITGGTLVKDIKIDHIDPPIKGSSVLTIWVKDERKLPNAVGDFSNYTLCLVNLENVDQLLSQVEFSFKVGCQKEFDCKTETVCKPETLKNPQIDYLSKDYASFRRLMLDRLAVIVPGWSERSPADVGIAVVEVLAYAADYLSYYQDAVATEAYLGTARKRKSVRRHSRLLDYPMHDGCNSRVWVAIKAGPSADEKRILGPSGDSPGDSLLTRVDAFLDKRVLSKQQFEQAISNGAQVFEAMHDLTLSSARSEMRFYTWGESECCLPIGSTSASFLDEKENLQGKLNRGDVLILEEVKGPSSGELMDADPSHRHVVRLTNVTFKKDLLLENAVVEVEWDASDALPFPLCISSQVAGVPVSDVSMAFGNVVLADFGYTRSEALPEPSGRESYRPRLSLGPLTFQGHARDRMGRPVAAKEGRPATFDSQAAAEDAMRWEMRDVLPAIMLVDDKNGQIWHPQRDLLSSDRSAQDFVAEVEEDGFASLRFGDDVNGKSPTSSLRAVYRIGNGKAGNIGAESIFHLFLSQPPKDSSRPVNGIEIVRNPFPAIGGEDSEPIDQVRLYAPQAFRTQERAVTEKDYAAAAQRHPEVQRAVATMRWTGSWHTVFIAVDRRGGRPVDQDFKEDLSVFLERFRMAGFDLEIVEPVFVPLDIVLTVCVLKGYFPTDVKKALLEIFSSGILADGSLGFFHPDNLTFNQDIYLSTLIARAMQVPGVEWVDASQSKVNRFQRLSQPSQSGILSGVLHMGAMEIARLDSDPNNPENGKIEFMMVGK
jgi:hypothetical protein